MVSFNVLEKSRVEFTVEEVLQKGIWNLVLINKEVVIRVSET